MKREVTRNCILMGCRESAPRRSAASAFHAEGACLPLNFGWPEKAPAPKGSPASWRTLPAGGGGRKRKARRSARDVDMAGAPERRREAGGGGGHRARGGHLDKKEGGAKEGDATGAVS